MKIYYRLLPFKALSTLIVFLFTIFRDFLCLSWTLLFFCVTSVIQKVTIDMKYRQTLIIILGLTFSQTIIAEIYKCKTEQGKTEYSNQPCENGDNKILATKKTTDTTDTPVTPTQPKVEIYMTQWCAYCKKAIAYLNEHKIPFKKYDIEKNLQAQQKKKQLAPNYSGIPLTVIDGQLIKGFSIQSYDKAFKF